MVLKDDTNFIEAGSDAYDTDMDDMDNMDNMDDMDDMDDTDDTVSLSFAVTVFLAGWFFVHLWKYFG
jgi:hypothetical protein